MLFKQCINIKDPDPDSLFTAMDPPIRIRFKL
jgi:hypothetical protein